MLPPDQFLLLTGLVSTDNAAWAAALEMGQGGLRPSPGLAGDLFL